MRSLRWRLIVTTATATALILGLCGIVLDASIRRSLTSEFDASLDRSAEAMKPLIYQVGIKTILDPQLTAMSEFTTPARSCRGFTNAAARRSSIRNWPRCASSSDPRGRSTSKSAT